MKRKYLFLLILALSIATISSYLLYKQQMQPVINCVDYGPTGWQKMEQKCSQLIQEKINFKNCLMNFSWSQVNQNTSIDEFKEGSLEINDSDNLNKRTPSSIKVFFYHQWAVDKEGNLYLLEQAG